MRTVIQRQDFHGTHNFFPADSALVLDCTFTDALMQGARMDDAVFLRCGFTRVSLYWAHLFRSVFVDCTFSEVEFRGAAMAECQFVRCALECCDFSRDNLGAETDLSEITFTDTERRDCR